MEPMQKNGLLLTTDKLVKEYRGRRVVRLATLGFTNPLQRMNIRQPYILPRKW